MNRHLLRDALVKSLSGFAAIALLLFLPAGTFAYWNAWLLIALLFVPMAVLCVVLYRKAPALLEKRLKNKEPEKEQRVVIALSALQFVAGFALAGLDFRFGWSRVPLGGVIAAACVFVVAFVLLGEVLRENAYLSRTVEVQENQTVVDTGLYGVVRHPMYSATVLLFWSMPLVLGSLWSCLVFLPYPLLLVKRIRSEEAVLMKGLAGYADYTRRVRYRLIPLVW